MSQPANDDFSQHLSDDEASYHKDALDNGTATNQPKQQQQQQHIPTTTTISNIKLPILKKEEYDIWAMEMEHYLEYIGNDVSKEDAESCFKTHMFKAFTISSSEVRKGYGQIPTITLQLEALRFFEQELTSTSIYLQSAQKCVPSTMRNTKEKAESRKSSTNSKKEEILTERQQEKKATSTDTSEDNPKILAFRRELEEIALKHLVNVSENTTTSTPLVNTGNEPVNPGSFDLDDSPMLELEIFHKSDTGIFDEASYNEEGVITDFNSLPTEIEVSPTPTLRIYNIHPKSQILGDPKSDVQTRSKEEPKKISKALQDDSWVQAIQEELLQFKLQQVLVLVDLPHGMKVIGTKWVYRNKRDERGVVVRNKARLVAQGYTQEEGINYDEVFALVARIEAIRLFLAFASFMGFIVYQMDIKGPFLYGIIDEEVYVSQPPGFVDPVYPKKVYKGQEGYHAGSSMSSMGELTFFLGLQVKQNKAGVFIFQDKYVAKILKKFDLVNVKTAITPMETKVALTKDEEAVDVDVHLYRSMIGHSQDFTSQCCEENHLMIMVGPTLTRNPQQVVVNFLDKDLSHGNARNRP
ncbi:putative ribonuclease H-like domain-containing protein [Tanacetum coccineum]|uniref:Ribonuclease H-like domain-containing protein n=1 Tax=Tanacetum coccineum TaxID=301880 RepID=A0ABQ5DTU6_9ASTR